MAWGFFWAYISIWSYRCHGVSVPAICVCATDRAQRGSGSTRRQSRVNGKWREAEMTTRVTTALIVMVVGGWLSGCSSEQQGAPAKASAPAPTSAPARSPGLRIAMIAKSATNPIFLSARKGAETAAKDLSGKLGVPIEVIWLTPPQEDGQI